MDEIVISKPADRRFVNLTGTTAANVGQDHSL
jgi:hypothetical protein